MQYNYNETPINGMTRKRARQIIIDNFLGQPPYITYQEEKLIPPGIMLPDEETTIIAGTVGGEIDPESVIALRDPDTGELTGETISVALISLALYSDYLNRAIERDNQE